MFITFNMIHFYTQWMFHHPPSCIQAKHCNPVTPWNYLNTCWWTSCVSMDALAIVMEWGKGYNFPIPTLVINCQTWFCSATVSGTKLFWRAVFCYRWLFAGAIVIIYKINVPILLEHKVVWSDSRDSYNINYYNIPWGTVFWISILVCAGNCPGYWSASIS